MLVIIKELQIIRDFDPPLIFPLFIEDTGFAIFHISQQKLKLILIAIESGNTQYVRTVRPGHSWNVNVLIIADIHPLDLTVFDLDNTNLDFRVRISCFRISHGLRCIVHGNKIGHGKGLDSRLIKLPESDVFAIRTPGKSCADAKLFLIDPIKPAD